MQLPSPAQYRPFASGRYDVSPGLRPFGSDFGNGEADKKHFQFDSEFPRYRETKLAARSERLEKYYPKSVELSRAAESAVARFLRERLASENPHFFRWKDSGDGAGALECSLTGEILAFDSKMRFVPENSVVHAKPGYRDAFDALASQLQEDLAIWALDPASGREWLAAIHLSFPNHWAAEEKIGRDFRVVHQPVAGFEKVAQTSDQLVRAMVGKGPFVRFAWGVATDDRLNHHPEPPAGTDPGFWKGRAFDPARPGLFARVERQTLQPFTAANVSLFTIRTYFQDAAKLSRASGETQQLEAAILSMSPAQLAYKGLTQTKDGLLGWLRSL